MQTLGRGGAGPTLFLTFPVLEAFLLVKRRRCQRVSIAFPRVEG